MAQVCQTQICLSQVGALPSGLAEKMIPMCLEDLRKFLASVANSTRFAQALATTDQIQKSHARPLDGKSPLAAPILLESSLGSAHQRFVFRLFLRWRPALPAIPLFNLNCDNVDTGLVSPCEL
jgi:hypothetical protein